MRSALARMRPAFQAALIPIGTTSSWFPSVGTDCTLAGVASTRLSATSAAAAICAVMNPDSRPGSCARKAGSPRSEEHTSELQSHSDLVCRLLLEYTLFLSTTIEQRHTHTLYQRPSMQRQH